jgi:3-hydroxybutyryl-CoA dehydrogenase
MSQIKTIGVIGAGQMGAGIAQVSAQAGYQTILFDSVTPALNKGMALIGSLLEKAVTKEKISTAERSSILERLSPASELTALKDCDLVIEAIIENSDVKTKLFSELDTVVKPSAILASNTSSISITKIAASTKRPDQVIGMHFMNPVPVMKLVEIIRGLQTSDHTYQVAQEVSLQMGKTTVLAIDSAGFVVNRILVPMINEAIFLLQEGVKAEDIDTAMKLGTNQPMGPLELADFVGLDTLLYIMQVLHKELGEDKYRPCPLLVKYIEAGWYGKKSGRGFYQY